MAFVPGYKYDVFISYAQQNNEDEWVSNLRHELKRLVYSKLGHKGDDFFFDAKLDRHGSTSTELFEAVASSAVLLVVLSDAYKGSHWCEQERERFIQAAGGLDAAMERIFLVHHSALGFDLTSPAQLASRPEEFRDLIGFQFWETDKDDGVPSTFAKDGAAFGKEINRLRYQLAKRLDSMKGDTAASNPGSSDASNNEQQSAATIYIAEPTFELFDAYRSLQSQLEGSGQKLKIVPGNQRFSHAPDGYEQSVVEHMSAADIFVQLMHAEPYPQHPAFPDGHEQWLADQARRLGKLVLRWPSPDAITDSLDAARREQLETNVFGGNLQDFGRYVATTAIQQRKRAEDLQKLEEHEDSSADEGASRNVLLRTAPKRRLDAKHLVDPIWKRQFGTAVVDDVSLVAAITAKSYCAAVLVLAEDTGGDGDCWIDQELFDAEETAKLQRIPLIVNRTPPPDAKEFLTRPFGLEIIDGTDDAAVNQILSVITGGAR